MKNKITIVLALLLATLTGLGMNTTAQASSSAKVYFKRYKESKKFKNEKTVTFSYKLPQLKGKSSAIKKINATLRKSYKREVITKENLYEMVKSIRNSEYTPTNNIHDLVSTNVTYNRNNIISIRSYKDYNYDQLIEISGWTFSLKTGKALNIFDVTKDSNSKVKARLVDRVKQYDLNGYWVKHTDYKATSFYLRGNKAYAYMLTRDGYLHPMIFTSRYK